MIRTKTKDHSGTEALATMLIGNIHLLPLPGSREYRGGGVQPILERAIDEARILAEAGFDAILIQNTGDGRFFRDGSTETVAYLTAIGAEIKRLVPCRLGVNVLSVGATASFAIAHALAFDFLRIKVYVGAVVTHEGVVSGSYEEALEYRDHLGADSVAIAADVFDRSSWQLGDWTIEEAARFARERGKADILVITGRSTSDSLTRARAVKTAVPGVPVWCGGGTTPENIAEMLQVYDGAIVGMGIKPRGDMHEPFDAELAKRYIRAAKAGQEEKRQLAAPARR